MPDLVHRVSAGSMPEILSIDDVPTTIKKGSKDGKTNQEYARERRTTIAPGNVLFFSIQEKPSNQDICEGEFVIINGLEYSPSQIS